MATVNKATTPAKKASSSAATGQRSATVKAKPAAAKNKPVMAKAKPAAPASKPAAPAVKPAAAQVKPQPKAKPAPEQKEKVKKPKLVRDSFTMPEAEYQVLGDVKKVCLKAGIDIKKSELLRIGVALIKTMDIARLKAAVSSLPPLKAGRPKKDK